MERVMEDFAHGFWHFDGEFEEKTVVNAKHNLILIALDNFRLRSSFFEIPFDEEISEGLRRPFSYIMFRLNFFYDAFSHVSSNPAQNLASSLFPNHEFESFYHKVR